MFDSQTRDEIKAVAARLAIEPAALLAIAEVEAAGRTFARVNGREEPLIRFEGHYFDRRLPAGKREEARAAGLAHPKAGAVKNPASQAARWALLARAASIDHKAAHESVSWGLGQVMGAHWEWLGYDSVDALVAEARSGVAGQTALMVRYIEKAGLAPAIRRGDWAAFARGYNGPDYKRQGYDRKIAQACRRYAGDIDPGDEAARPSSLRRGKRGSDVRILQRLLTKHGHALAIDGVFGPGTEAAVRRFQAQRGLEVDGIVGPRTLEAMATQPPALVAADGFRHRLATWLSRLLRGV